MKKIVIVFMCLFSIFTLLGCKKKEEEKFSLDLPKIKESLSNLSTDKFDRSIVFGKLYNSSYFTKELVEVFDYELKDIFGISKEYITEHSIGYNKDTNEFYMVIKASNNKVKEEINNFIKRNKLEKKVAINEYKGYLIYISSTNNEKVFEEIKNSKTLVFNFMAEITIDKIEEILGLKPNQVEEFLMMMPMMVVHSNTYIIVKPVLNEKKNVEETINKYMEKLEEQWKSYLPAQYELVRNRKYVEYGGYLIYIVSPSNDAVFKEIKKHAK
jgi:hypothetical protein